MRITFFAIFIVFCVWLGYEIHKHRNLDQKSYEDFWERERTANRTRRKPLDDLAYITVPLDRFPFEKLKEDEQIQDYHRIVRELSEQPIVNLTGISNTDLKLRYGAPNIDMLSAFDQRYTTLVCTLQSWAERLYSNGFSEEAAVLLTFAAETHTDIYATYELLVKIYEEASQTEKIADLIPLAESINSLSRKRILALLTEHTASAG